MSTKWRWILWLSLLAGTVVAAVYPTEPVLTPHKKNGHRADSAIVAPLTAEPTTANAAGPIAKNHLPDLDHNPFDPVSWDAAPPVPPAPPAPPVEMVVAQPAAPVEPPMPFQYMGRLKEEDGTTVIYFSKGQESIVAHVGDALDANYKLVAIDDNKLTISYLPMDHLHAISLDNH